MHQNNIYLFEQPAISIQTVWLLTEKFILATTMNIILPIIPLISGFLISRVATQGLRRSPECMSQKNANFSFRSRKQSWERTGWPSYGNLAAPRPKDRLKQGTCHRQRWQNPGHNNGIMNRSQARVHRNICMQHYLHTFSRLNCNLPSKNKHPAAQTHVVWMFSFYFLSAVCLF